MDFDVAAGEDSCVSFEADVEFLAFGGRFVRNSDIGFCVFAAATTNVRFFSCDAASSWGGQFAA